MRLRWKAGEMLDDPLMFGLNWTRFEEHVVRNDDGSAGFFWHVRVCCCGEFVFLAPFQVFYPLCWTRILKKIGRKVAERLHSVDTGMLPLGPPA